MNLHQPSIQPNSNLEGENISEYVAELQLHMALQARKLLPNLKQVDNSREQLLQETQAHVEKIASRQTL